MMDQNRRAVLLGAASLLITPLLSQHALAQSADVEQLYGPVEGEPFPIPAIDLRRIHPQFLRALVNYESNERAGTIIIDPAHRFLYLTDGNGQALRYGVGVGRQGFAWSGVAMIHDKRAWPDWYPPKEMLARDPAIMQSMDHLQGGIGMPGGQGNPLGARAMYLFQGNKDTLYRIHGTIEPWTIGSSISSGCIRMINQDVMDLYQRVGVGTKVVVLGSGARREAEQPQDQDAEPQPFRLEPQYADPAQPMQQPDPDE